MGAWLQIQIITGTRMKKSFRFYLTLNLTIIIIATILILEIAVIFSVKNYFYKDATSKLKSQSELNLGYLYRYIDFSKGIRNVVLDDAFTFFQYNTGHLELLDEEGNLLLSTIGLTNTYLNNTNILTGIKESGYYTSIDKFSFSDSKIVSVALPITYQNKMIGIAVFQSSLKEADESIFNVVKLIITIGVVVAVIAVIISFIASDMIVKPIYRLKKYSDELAKGNYNYKYEPQGPLETVKLGESMNYMRDEVLKRDAVKNEFIANVSHELKTPLTSIKGWAYTLKEDPSDEELLRDGLEIIEQESDRLAQMVNDLLDFSRLLNKKVKLEKRPIDMVDFLGALEKQFKPRAIAENKNFYIKSNVKSLKYSNDPDKLRQVFINLLDNAFKFTSENGTIKIDLKDMGEEFVVSVVDDGDGIPEKDREHVFEKFYRGTSKKSHTGIGLSIVYQIVKLSGGDIKLVSEVGEGTSFIITLPKEFEEENVDEK